MTPPRWILRTTTVLALVIGGAAAAATPAAAASEPDCATTAPAQASPPARPGTRSKPLTAAQVRSREADLAAALRERAARGPATLATVTSVVVHVIAENTTRAGGYIRTR